MKTLQVYPDNRTASEVILTGVAESDELTPKIARTAMEIATGNPHHNGTVVDDVTGFRITAKTTRRIREYEEPRFAARHVGFGKEHK